MIKRNTFKEYSANAKLKQLLEPMPKRRQHGGLPYPSQRDAAKRRHHGTKPYPCKRDAIGTHINWLSRATSNEERREERGVLLQGGSGRVVGCKLGDVECRIMP